MNALRRAEALFAELARHTADPPGVTRASFGEGEATAHALITREAESLGLEVQADEIGNLYITLPGRDRAAPVLMTGSHLDSVPHGGNFDGAAGVLAGLVLLERLAQGPQPPCDVTLMAIRAEEMIWFPEHYLGSRAAFGLLPPDTPDRVQRADTGRSLSDHMTQAGFCPDAIRQRRTQLDPHRIAAFVELHIEQGPILVERACPVGIVTAIRGNIRHRHASIQGETTHAGGVPRHARRDAVFAGAQLAAALEAFWQQAEAEGEDMVLTLGTFSTDPQQHGITKVPGHLSFTLDMRSQSETLIDRFAQHAQALCARIARDRGVRIDLGRATRAASAAMSPGIRSGLCRAAVACGLEVQLLPSGGGHDCATFAAMGIPTGMIFVRNNHGSHNPDEHMDLADFALACDVLTRWAQEVLFPPP